MGHKGYMNKIKHYARFFAFPAFILLIVGVLTVMQDNALYERCVDTRTGRVQGNERAEVLRQFLDIAAEARQQAADAADTPNERQFNQQAADDYTALRERVKDVPLPDC